MFPLFSRKKNDDEHIPSHDEKKSSLDDFQGQDNVTVLHKDEMVKVEGGKTETRSFSDMLGWSSSLGETIPQ